MLGLCHLWSEVRETVSNSRFLCPLAALEVSWPYYNFLVTTISIEVDNPLLFIDRITLNAPALPFMVRGP